MVQLWHKSSNSEDADLRHPSTNGASFTGGANDVDEDAKTDVARSDSGNNAKWAWQQVLEVPLTTTVKALKEDLLSTSLAPASTVRGDEEFASTERSEDHNDDDDKVIASQRVRLVYAGRPLIACRVSTGGLNEQGKVNSAELEATVRVYYFFTPRCSERGYLLTSPHVIVISRQFDILFQVSKILV